jgi:hypothetical protein
MDALGLLQQRLEDLQQGQLVLFCITCSQSISTIIQELGTQELGRLWAICIDASWDVAGGEDSTRALNVYNQIKARPEADCSDSHYKEYYVMRAISMLDYTFGAIQGENAIQNSKWVSNGLYSFAADLDFAVPEASRIGVVNGSGFLKESQIEFQNDVLECLVHDSSGPVQLFAKLRNRAQEWGIILHKLLPAYCNAQGWMRL